MNKSYLLTLIPVFLWSTAFVGVKAGLEYATPLAFAGIRFMLSGILLAIVIRDIPGLLRHTAKHWKLVLKTSVLQTSLFYGLYYLGINQIPASIAAIIVGSIPLFSAVTAHLFMHNDHLNLRKIISLAAAVGGIVLISISRGSVSDSGSLQVLGIILMLTAAVSESFLQVILKKNVEPYDPMKLNAAQIFIGGTILFLISIPAEGLLNFRQPPVFYLSLLWLSFVSAAAFSIWYSLIQRPETRISELSMMKFLNPPLGATISWIIMAGDSPDPYSVSGMIIISLAVLFFYSKSRRSAPPGI